MRPGPQPAVRLAPGGHDPYDLLLALGAGEVVRRPGRPPAVRTGHASVSRTEGLVAAALSPAGVGIDVERVRPLPDLADLVSDHLGPREAEAVRDAPEPLLAFYEVWVAMEAMLKAEGTGIVIGLDPPPEVRARWCVVPLEAGPDHRAAVARPR